LIRHGHRTRRQVLRHERSGDILEHEAVESAVIVGSAATGAVPTSFGLAPRSIADKGHITLSTTDKITFK
jgi:hypothetical protein